MSSADDALRRAHVYLQDARDRSLDDDMRVGALDGSRISLLEARRARALPEQMHPLLLAILEVGIADRNQHARALVAQVIEETCLRDMKKFTIVCTPYLERTLADSNVLVIKRAVRTLTTLFRKVMGYVVSVGVGEGPSVFPSSCLRIWLEMQKKAVEFMNSSDAGIQKAATKFSETVILALTYSGGRPMAEHFTLDYAVHRGLDHPLLDLGVLEAEGRRCVMMVAGLIYTGLGVSAPSSLPPSSLFVPTARVAPASLMTALSVIGNLVKRREKILELTVPPLILAVHGITGSRGAVSPVFAQLPEGQRRSVIMMLRLTLFASRVYPHTRANPDLMGAYNDIFEYETKLVQENRARLQKQAEMARRDAAARSGAKMRPRLPQSMPAMRAPDSESLPMKRPRVPDQKIPAIEVPDRVAFGYMQYILRTMPPNEVVHFVMTRLLLDTPELPAPSQQVSGPANSAVEDPRASKRARKVENEISRDSLTSRKPAPVVRRQVPPVAALKLKSEDVVRLLHRVCNSILKREDLALASGASPMRNLVLGRLLACIALSDTSDAWALCKEACSFIVDKIDTRSELALAWLHAVLHAHAAQEASDVQEESVANLLVMSKQRAVAVAASAQGTPPNCGKSSLIESEASVLSIPAPTPESQDTGAKQEDTMESTTQLENADGGEEKNVAEKIETPSRDEIKAEVKVEAMSVVDEDGDDVMQMQSCEAYEKLLVHMLELIMENDNTNDAQFTNLIVEAPIIPDNVIEMLRAACRDVSKNELALRALHDIICGRYGTDRTQALNILLSLSVDQDDVIRGPVIRLVADRLYCDLHGSVPSSIEDYALRKLTTAITAAKMEDDAIAELERSTWLITALCAQKHDLLHELAKGYLLADEGARTVLLNRAKLLSSQLGPEPASAIALIRGRHAAPLKGNNSANNDAPMTDGIEDFALIMLSGIIKKYGKPAPVLVDAACVRFGSSHDARFLEAVLSGLSRDQLIHYLDDLIKLAALSAKINSNGSANTASDASMDSKPFRQMFRTLMESQPPALSPCDLLIALHALGPSVTVSTAIRACFELKVIFKQAVVAQALQQLIAQTPLSSLLMNTVRLTRTLYADRERYLNETILVPLISKKVWTNQALWVDFLRYCSELMERSAPILLRLPVTQLEDAFDKRPGLVEVFRALADNPRAFKKMPLKQRKAISAALSKSSVN